MKNKSFDCVEMKHKGAEAVYQRVATLSVEQQLEYWRKGSETLRQQMKPATEVEFRGQRDVVHLSTNAS